MTGCQAFQADHQRLDGGVATDGLDARHHSFRDVVATGDAAEDVDEDGLHLVLANQNVCVCVCVFFEYFLSQASYDLACVVGLHQLPPQFCIPLECRTFGSPMMILGYRWLQTISEMTGKSAVAGSQARNTH